MVRISVVLQDEELNRLMSIFQDMSGNVGEKSFPNTFRAQKAAARSVQKAWQDWARGGSLDGAENIKSASPKLASSIKTESKGDLSSEIYTDSPQMEKIQKGTSDYDMKNEHYYKRRKSRVSKDGIPYVIIPLAWGTPNKDGSHKAHFSAGNTIPMQVYQMVKQKSSFKRSERTGGTHLEPNARGEMIERHEYNWGDMVDGVSGNVSGLYAFPDVKKGSKYFTFRIISANTKEGWVRKGIPANDVVGALARATEKQVNDMLQAGLEADLDL